MNALKRLLIECHPDRHGGDHSHMERVYAARRVSNSKHNVRRCGVCLVRVGPKSKHCMMHVRQRVAIAAAMMLACVAAVAGDVRLAWDASPTPGVTYTLYGHTNALTSTNKASAPLIVDVGTNLTIRAETVGASGRWYFGATAVQAGIQSDLSNVLIVDFPAPPTNSRTVAIQWGITLASMTNNAFFKLYWP